MVRVVDTLTRLITAVDPTIDKDIVHRVLRLIRLDLKIDEHGKGTTAATIAVNGWMNK